MVNRDGPTKVDSVSLFVFRTAMKLMGVKVQEVPPGTPITPTNQNAVAAYSPASKTIKIREGEATFYQMVHEMFHAVHHYIEGPNHHNIPKPVRESFVWSRLKDFFWGFMNHSEKDHATGYLMTYAPGGINNPTP